MDLGTHKAAHFGDFGIVSDVTGAMHFGDFCFQHHATYGGIIIYRGTPTPADIDYDTPIGSRLGTGTIKVPSPPHVADTDYWYAARQVSCFGRIEQNQQVHTIFRVDSGGNLDYERPDECVDVSAKVGVGGVVKINWTHRKITGTAPTTFNVYYDNGTGTLDLVTPVGTVTAVGDGAYSHTTAALVDGTEYLFVVRAEDTNSNESYHAAPVPVRADATAPAALTTVTSGTVL